MDISVIYDERIVGSAKVNKCGLYYKIHCACCVKEPGFHRAYAKGDSGTVDLGICLRKGDILYLDKSVPQRVLGACLQTILLKQEQRVSKVVPLMLGPQIPFSEFPDLELAILKNENGKSCLLIRFSRDNIV